MLYPASPAPLTADRTVLVTGGHGMLGAALRAELGRSGVTRILAPRRAELDLLDGAATTAYVTAHRPDVVFHLASVVFGLLGNMQNQVRAISESTLLNHNVLMACAEARVRKICFAGSVAAYPFPYASLPLSEDQLWQGLPHAGERGYAHAKRHALAYLELLREHSGVDFFYALLTNLYGPEDRFEATSGHVIPSLILKLHHAMRDGGPFMIWGDGTARRDFMHVADAARALLSGTEALSGTANVSAGISVTIAEVVDALVRASGYEGEVVWQTDKPVGVPDRSVSDAALRGIGFACRYTLAAGIADTWEWFERNVASARR